MALIYYNQFDYLLRTLSTYTKIDDTIDYLCVKIINHNDVIKMKNYICYNKINNTLGDNIFKFDKTTIYLCKIENNEFELLIFYNNSNMNFNWIIDKMKNNVIIYHCSNTNARKYKIITKKILKEFDEYVDTLI